MHTKKRFVSPIGTHRFHDCCCIGRFALAFVFVALGRTNLGQRLAYPMIDGFRDGSLHLICQFAHRGVGAIRLNSIRYEAPEGFKKGLWSKELGMEVERWEAPIRSRWPFDLHSAGSCRIARDPDDRKSVPCCRANRIRDRERYSRGLRSTVVDHRWSLVRNRDETCATVHVTGALVLHCFRVDCKLRNWISARRSYSDISHLQTNEFNYK